MREYVVTDLAGQTIAGMPSPAPGSLVYLTEEQAAYYLREQHIVLPPEPTPEPVVPVEAEADEPKAPKAKKHARD